jgi:hypothetical protein
VRYALSSYVKRKHFVFKVLKVEVISLFKRHEKKYGGGKVPSVLGAFAKLLMRLLALSCLSFYLNVCPSARMEQLGAHRKDFHGI